VLLDERKPRKRVLVSQQLLCLAAVAGACHVGVGVGVRVGIGVGVGLGRKRVLVSQQLLCLAVAGACQVPTWRLRPTQPKIHVH
jgi:hypothetical protein